MMKRPAITVVAPIALLLCLLVHPSCRSGRHERANAAAAAWYEAGVHYWDVNQDDSAMVCFIRADSLCNRTTPPELVMRIHANFGRMFTYYGLYGDAREHYRRVYEMVEELDDSLLMAYGQCNIGKTYLEDEQADSGASLACFRKAYELNHHDELLLQDFYQYMGMYYLYKAADRDSALHYLRLSELYPCDEEDERSLTYSMMGEAYMLDEYTTDSVELYMLKALELPTSSRIYRLCCETLGEIALARHDTAAWHRYMELTMSVMGSMMSSETTMTPYLVAYNEYMHQQRHKRQQQTAFGLVIVIILVCVCLTGGILLAVKLTRVHRHDQTEMEQLQQDLEAYECRQGWNELLLLVQNTRKELESLPGYPLLMSQRDTLKVRQLYETVLCLNDWNAFAELMNSKLNGVVDKLLPYYDTFKSSSQKGIMLCCLHLLELTNEEIELVLDYTSDSRISTEKRLRKRFHLGDRTELLPFLQSLVEQK